MKQKNVMQYAQNGSLAAIDFVMLKQYDNKSIT